MGARTRAHIAPRRNKKKPWVCESSRRDTRCARFPTGADPYGELGSELAKRLAFRMEVERHEARRSREESAVDAVVWLGRAARAPGAAFSWRSDEPRARLHASYCDRGRSSSDARLLVRSRRRRRRRRLGG